MTVNLTNIYRPPLVAWRYFNQPPVGHMWDIRTKKIQKTTTVYTRTRNRAVRPSRLHRHQTCTIMKMCHWCVTTRCNRVMRTLKVNDIHPLTLCPCTTIRIVYHWTARLDIIPAMDSIYQTISICRTNDQFSPTLVRTLSMEHRLQRQMIIGKILYNFLNIID